MKNLIFTVVVLALSIAARGEIRLGSPFTDGAVLQRGQVVPVWGVAESNAEVKVSFAGQTKTTTANADGKWRVNLDALAASKEGRELVVESGKEVSRVKDVLVGEVWFCSGQSNCELPLWGPRCRFRDKEGYLTAKLTNLPEVRFAYCSNYKVSKTPREFSAEPVQWKPFTPENLLDCSGKSRNWAFSAMGVYFARELYAALDVPVGIIGAYWGGSPIRSWTPNIPEGQMFNEMVAPWCPYAMKGFIWYQGCSDLGSGAKYRELMHKLYNGWSTVFENPKLSLRFVQLAPYHYNSNDGDKNLVAVQEAQEAFAKEQPNAGLVVINDVGNMHDIHPNDKRTVGLRLAALALKRDYGFDVPGESPSLSGWKVEDGRFVISFDNVKEWVLYTADQSVPPLFEVAGADGVYRPAEIANLIWHKNRGNLGYFDGEVKGTELIVGASGVKEPKHIRFLHKPPFFGYLTNEANLPLGPFHIDVEEVPTK